MFSKKIIKKFLISFVFVRKFILFLPWRPSVNACKVEAMGLEPMTSRVWGERSSRLSYASMCLILAQFQKESIENWKNCEKFPVRQRHMAARRHTPLRFGTDSYRKSRWTFKRPHPCWVWGNPRSSEVSRSRSFTSRFVISGYFWRRRAMAPETMGVDIDVPLFIW